MSNFGKNVWFIGVNSSYIHTNPAIRILAAKIRANWTEFNTNQHKDFVLRSLFELNPRAIAFSCYIWDIEYVLEIADSLKGTSKNSYRQILTEPIKTRINVVK